jgi:hypothetical protein
MFFFLCIPGPYVRDLVACCLASFRSDTWSVRNAGLQLFGALAPRILGQKKVRDDAVGYNQVEELRIQPGRRASDTTR